MSKFFKSRKVLIGWVLLILVCCISLFEAVRLINVQSNVQRENVMQRICSYELSEIRRTRNTSYRFVLDNGEKIWIPSELLENQDVLYAQEELCFHYAAPKGGFHFSYTGIEITSVDGEIQFVSRAESLREIELGITVYLIISIPMLLLIIAPFVIGSALYLSEKQRKMRGKNNKK